MTHSAFRTLTLTATLLLTTTARSQNEVYSFPGAPHDHLGTTVAAAGDVDLDGVGDMLVSARTGTYVQVLGGADGSVLHTLTGNGGDFGRSLASAGDVNGDGHADLIVGAPLSDNFAGVATVYSGADGQVLHTLLGAELDLFGSAVTGIGDVDHDGFDDFAVGAVIFLGPTGYVKVFCGLDAHVIVTLDPAGNCSGITLASAGDLDGDGIADLLVGTPSDTSKGSVSAFSLANEAMLYKIQGTEFRDALGTDIDAGGDVNGDQVPDFIAGAPQWPGAGIAAYARVCSGVDGKKIFLLEGDAPDNITDFFATSVAHAGDVNGDGIDDFLVGAPVEDKGHVNGGRAWLYSGKTAGLLYAFDGAITSDELGTSLALIPDVDGDGRAEILVGAPENASNDPGAGRAVVYSGNNLFHFAEPHEVAAGQKLTHRTSEGASGAPTILVVTEVSGVPTFLIIGGIAFFDGSGKRVFSVTVPPGLSGLSITHRAFALHPAGFILDSANEVVTLL